MKFIYGKNDFKTIERGEENCYLLTNGLGGFSSCTMIGSNTRNDHAVLMAAILSPNCRWNIVHRLEEEIQFSHSHVYLSSQQYIDGSKKEDGYRYLDSFEFEDFPKWTYRIDGAEVVKKIAMRQGKNEVVIRYDIENRSRETIKLSVTPHFQFVKKGEQLTKEQSFFLQKFGEEDVYCITSNNQTLYFCTDGDVKLTEKQFCQNLFYAYDECDGRRAVGNTFINHIISKDIFAGEKKTLCIVYSMENAAHTSCIAKNSTHTLPRVKNGILDNLDDNWKETNIANITEQIFKEERIFRQNLVKHSGLKNTLAKTLVKSANQFISYRESTDGKTILAGYPFFEDWGRDTMIALPGCCISTGQFDDAKSILRTFANYCHNGLMPNLFPEGKNEPQYNTVDAALLFINAVYLYYEKTKDFAFVKEMWKIMEDIIEQYKNGTDYHIHMDDDGLIFAGGGLDQVTWMDVRVGEILPTPRHGKPVEINAYWYNALCIMDKFSKKIEEKKENALSRAKESRERKQPQYYQSLAQKVKKSFCEKFWNDEKGCLFDVLSEQTVASERFQMKSEADKQIRCNQIWAVSMPYTMLDDEKEKKIVDLVFEKLYTPYGLRTLEKNDAQFCKNYGGEQLKRDLAYHQGTVWTYPLGAYYLAYLKVKEYKKEAIEKVREQLSVLEAAMREGCIGQLPEIYDGETPTASRGCFAQAWSVGEMLRVFEKIEQF